MSKPAETPDRPVRRRAPAMSFEEREDQLVCLAMDLAEEQIRSKTASSQVITEFLRRGSTKERLEKERLERENELLRAKVESLQSSKRVEELYKKAINAFRSYGGDIGGPDEEQQGL